jgi:hypothetical protein
MLVFISLVSLPNKVWEVDKFMVRGKKGEREEREE